MSNIKNKVQLLGHLGNDPEMRVFDSGKVKGTFRMATNDRFKTSSGEWQDKTEWHNITTWDNMAKRAEKYLRKGSEVLVSGKLTYTEYQNDKGEKRWITEIKADVLEIIGKRNVEEAKA